MLEAETTGAKLSVSCGWMDQQLRLIQYLCPAKRERTHLQRRSFHVISTDVDEQAFAPEEPGRACAGSGRDESLIPRPRPTGRAAESVPSLGPASSPSGVETGSLSPDVPASPDSDM